MSTVLPIRIRAEAVREIHEFDLWTTMLLTPHSCADTVRGFNYATGGCVSGGGRGLVATRLETNLNVSGMLTESLYVQGVEWRIPPITPSRLTCSDDYHVTLEDVNQIASKGLFALYFGGEKPYIKQRLAAHVVSYQLDNDPVRMSCYIATHEDTTDRDVKVWGQKFATPTTDNALFVHAACDKLWCELDFVDPPALGGPVEFIVTLSCKQPRGVQ